MTAAADPLEPGSPGRGARGRTQPDAGTAAPVAADAAPSRPAPAADGNRTTTALVEHAAGPAITTTPSVVTAGPRTSDPHHVVVDVVVPVHDEEVDLGPSVRRLHAYLELNLPVAFRITIADNASTDGTWAIAQELAQTLPHVAAHHLDEKGRGRALKAVWSASDADVLAYMDVDLSTDLAAVLPLVAPLLSGHSDLAIGSRLTRQSRVVRGPKRELISRSYNLILRTTLAARFSDAQCGFKAIRADRARELLPLVEDTGWFFDTELLVLAERAGLRIHEVPVDWTDDPDSRVDIVSTAVADLKGIARLARGMADGSIPVTSLPSYRGTDVPPRLGRQLVRFALVGVLSTAAYLVLYLLLRGAMDAQWANASALLLTAVGNTALNRRLTFGVRGATDRFRHQLQGLVVFGIGLALTSSSLAVLHAVTAAPARWVEVVVLVAANVGATLVRFLLFRSWVFPRRAPLTALTEPTELPVQPDRRSSR